MKIWKKNSVEFYYIVIEQGMNDLIGIRMYYSRFMTAYLLKDN